MMPNLGIPELTIMFVILTIWIIPVAAGIWALYTLSRVRSTVDTMRAQLERVEQALRARG
jgi:hypothetical protein